MCLTIWSAVHLSAHENFRLFLSGEPGIIPPLPINLLMICLKLNNEPPEGLKPNLLKALLPYDDAFYENCSKVAELRSVAFMICFFHAIILERKKFGPQGWNVRYDFNTGDLNGSCLVAVNYVENNTKIPWDVMPPPPAPDLGMSSTMLSNMIVACMKRNPISAFHTNEVCSVGSVSANPS